GVGSTGGSAFGECVTEDRRSLLGGPRLRGMPRRRSRGPGEIAVVGCGFRGVGWGAWASKIRRSPIGAGSYAVGAEYASQGVGEGLRAAIATWARPQHPDPTRAGWPAERGRRSARR